MSRSRVLKFLNTASTVAIFVLIGRLVMGKLDIGFAYGALLISAFWLFITFGNLSMLLQTYCSYMSRLRVRVPLVTGLILSVSAIVVTVICDQQYFLCAVAGVEIVLWGLIYRQYRTNKQLYEKMGHGPLPVGVLINPDREMLEPGGFLLSAGDLFAPKMHDAVDHAELCIGSSKKKGRMEVLSSWIGHGTVVNYLRRITSGVLQKKSFYIALVPKTPLTDEECEVLSQIAQQMRSENEAARKRFQTSMDRLVRCLPPGWQPWVSKRTQWDGYDYLGVLVGRRRHACWTCFGSTLEAWERMCDEMERRGRPRKRLCRYGTGLFALGTGIFDPLVVVRLLHDPELHLLTVDDKTHCQELRAKTMVQAVPALDSVEPESSQPQA